MIVLGDDFAGIAHVALLERTPQAVGDHRIEQLAVTETQTFADFLEQVGRVARRLHPARHRDVDIADTDPLVGQHDRLQSRSAHLVDGDRRDVIGQAALERRLPRRVLAFAGRDDVAHDALVDDAGVDARAPDGLRDDEGAEFRGGQILQHAEQLAGGGPDGADDDGLTHTT